jgi:hypothetical protein
MKELNSIDKIKLINLVQNHIISSNITTEERKQYKRLLEKLNKNN